MDDQVLAFYDQLADAYHLIFADWRQAMRRQSQTLDTLISAEVGPPPRSLLDCSCGIGTQAIGLAERGYEVHGTDISPASIARARGEAAALGVALSFDVADMRMLPDQVSGVYDIVLSCDNALPHLLEDADLHRATRGMWAKTAAGGLLLLSIRDYDALAGERPRTQLPRVFDDAMGRRIVFQVWDWADGGRTYTAHQFITREQAGEWKTDHYATRYRALLRSELTEVIERAGFRDVRWAMPEATGYYQPIALARR